MSSKSISVEENEKSEYKREWNVYNKILTREFVEDLLRRITGCQITIGNLDLYQQAFVHNSVYKKDLSPSREYLAKKLRKSDKFEKVSVPTYNGGKPLVFTRSYEALEFMGDGWIGCIVGDYLYHRFINQNEGFLTKLKNKLVKCEQLAEFASHLGLGEYILLSYKVEMAEGRKNSSILEDVFEAFCGAIQQDLGLPVLQIFVKNLIELTINFDELIRNDDNYKDILLRYFQKNGWGNPTYSVVKVDGPSNKRLYTVGVDYFEILGRHGINPMIDMGEGKKFMALGMEKTKKKAEQKAAKQVLDFLDLFLQSK
jgi:ribonuclease-3